MAADPVVLRQQRIDEAECDRRSQRRPDGVRSADVIDPPRLLRDARATRPEATEHPSQVSEILDPPAGRRVVEVDQPGWPVTIDDHVPGRDVVVAHGFGTGGLGRSGKCVVHRPDEPCERRHLFVRPGHPIVAGVTLLIRHDVATLRVASQPARHPRDRRRLEPAQHPLDELRPIGAWAPDGIAHPHDPGPARATHQRLLDVGHDATVARIGPNGRTGSREPVWLRPTHNSMNEDLGEADANVTTAYLEAEGIWT